MENALFRIKTQAELAAFCVDSMICTGLGPFMYPNPVFVMVWFLRNFLDSFKWNKLA
jgi:hypothetical protein